MLAVPDLRDLLNDAAFRARGRLRWSAPEWALRRGSFERLMRKATPQASERMRALLAAHDLRAWEALLSDEQLHEDLYVLDLLERYLPGARGPGLDVGAKNGSLLPALQAAVPGPWDQVELDAHRRYLDLSTRRGRGERIARAYPGSRFIAGSVTELHGQYGLCTWFLPFILEGPLRAWGLPRRFFAPEALLDHVLARVAPGGTLLVVNQGEAERDRQRALLVERGLKVEELGPLESVLSPFRRTRFGFRWRAPG